MSPTLHEKKLKILTDQVIKLERRLEQIEDVLSRIPPLTTFFPKHFNEENTLERRVRLIEEVVMPIKQDADEQGLEHSNQKGK